MICGCVLVYMGMFMSDDMWVCSCTYVDGNGNVGGDVAGCG
jgi:hypothetical protein